MSFNYKAKRSLKEPPNRIRSGSHGSKEWKGRKGGWKAANCGNLVARATKDINNWIKKRYTILNGNMGGALVVPGWYKQEDSLGITT